LVIKNRGNHDCSSRQDWLLIAEPAFDQGKSAMTGRAAIQEQLDKAIELRRSNKPEEAKELLQSLLASFPDDPDINCQMAWTHDFMGLESEAVAYYERALGNGLVHERASALLGLGSTYRCLGEYEKSLRTFDQAIAEFPENRSFRVFRAMTLFNLGRHEDSVSQLLLQLLDTTSDDSIKSYDRALRFYHDKLSQTWR
jgi:tetratricopeptide (TPR) repeat protein